MPSTKVTLAWAVPVPIDIFGAHLKAYDTTRPMINTLRLCNRFGQGEKATIAKLPVELIQEIEEYMLAEERAVQLKEWKRELKCWEGRCKPIQHFTKKRIVELYNDLREGYADDDPFMFKEAKKCTDSVRQFVEDELRMEYEEGDYDCRDGWWRDEHEARVDGWFEKVGKPLQTSSGQLAQLQPLLLKDFGLQLWFSHGDTDTLGYYMDDIVSGSTISYLHMPNTYATSQDWHMNIQNPDLEFRRVDTQHGRAHDVTIPTQPSETSLGRFDRALKILAIDPALSRPKTASSAAEGTKGEETKEEEEKKKPATEVDASKKQSEPKLKMFIIDEGHGDDW